MINHKVIMKTPFDEIKKSLKNNISLELTNFLPEKWEKIGDIVIIKLDEKLKSYAGEIGKTYAEVLHCKTVLNDVGGISGIYREPNVELLYGSKNTETVHKENGIRYKLDAQKIMFSSGNMDERLRMANISNKNETVVDLFAGIGYFTLPMAVYSKPKKVFSCEINHVAYEYLCKNIVLNHVTSIVQPLFGDNRKTAPKNVAERVVMGYFIDTEKFLPVAFNCLKKYTGFIHYHDVCLDKLFPEKPLKMVEKTAKKYERTAKLLAYRVIKSYAPGVSHIVLDIQVGK